MTTLRFTWWVARKLWRVYAETAAVWMAPPARLRQRQGRQMQDFVRIRLEQEFGWELS